MNRSVSKKLGILSFFCIAIMTIALYLPLTCYGAGMTVDFSPKIINIDSQRWGEIRVYTDMRYSSFVANGGIAFAVYDPDDKGKWGRAWNYVEDNRISNLAPADYRKKSALTQNLMMAISKIAAKIKLEPTVYRG